MGILDALVATAALTSRISLRRAALSSARVLICDRSSPSKPMTSSLVAIAGQGLDLGLCKELTEQFKGMEWDGLEAGWFKARRGGETRRAASGEWEAALGSGDWQRHSAVGSHRLLSPQGGQI